MHIAITGASGLIGTELTNALRARGDRVTIFVRREPVTSDEARWDPERGTIDAEGLAGIDAAIHLAGEPIGARRWTATQKARILESRERGTELFTRALAALRPAPPVLLSASAIGFYGERGDEELDETASSGTGFSAHVVRHWEAAAQPAIDAGIRIVFLRSGLVLSPSGGLLKRMLLPFRLGLGGRLGSGTQWMSWISIGDHLSAMLRLLDDERARGPVNLAAPSPVRNTDFTRELARVLRRPAVIPIPKALIAIPFGRELTDDLLSSIRVVPRRLGELGFTFEQPELGPALRALLGR